MIPAQVWTTCWTSRQFRRRSLFYSKYVLPLVGTGFYWRWWM